MYSVAFFFMTITSASPYTVVTSNDPDRSDKNHAASLPYFAIYMASQFASTDECKYPLHSVYVKKEKETIQVISTDGHRCFRFAFPSNDVYFSNYDELFIDAKQFRKSFNRKATRLDLYINNYCEFIETKKDLSEKIDAKFNWFHKDSHMIGNCGLGSFISTVTFPNVDQLWPDQFKPVDKIAFNADYLASFCKVVSKFSTQKTLVFKGFTSAKTPTILECNCNVEGFQDIPIEYLLMPIMIRF